MKIAVETEDEKFKWSTVALAVVAALVIAGLVTYPHEIISFGEKLLAARETTKPGQDGKGTACTGAIVVNCKVEQNIVQAPALEKRAEPPVVEARRADPLVSVPPSSTPAIQESPKDKARNVKPMNFAAHEKDALKKFAESGAFYRFIGPKDDLSLLGIDRFKPGVNLCALKMYLPCFMPKGFGRDIVVREMDD